MAGLEVVVRPVVLPNLRPAPARSLPPADDPEKGFCIIKGQGGRQVDLTYSSSMSTSKSVPVKSERRFDEVRVFQKEDDGTVNEDNFVDIEVANRIKTTGGNLPTVNNSAGGTDGPNQPAPPAPQKEIISQEDKTTYYAPVRTGENYKLIKKDGKRIYQVEH